MYKKIRVYDLDGCLIDSSHRYRSLNGSIDLTHWRKHDKPEFISKDTMLPLLKWLKSDLQNPAIYVIFATARTCVKNDGNYQFLEDHGIVPDKFIHRMGVNDNRGGAELKLQGLEPILNLDKFKNVPVHIFEDNISYLKKMVDRLKFLGHEVVGHYIPSLQGH